MEQNASKVVSFRHEIFSKAAKQRPIKPHVINTMLKSCPNPLLPHRVGPTGPSTLTPLLHPFSRSRSGSWEDKRSHPGREVQAWRKGAFAWRSRDTPFQTAPKPATQSIQGGHQSINPREAGYQPAVGLPMGPCCVSLSTWRLEPALHLDLPKALRLPVPAVQGQG